jgi:OOP family OmpA-OmpF porin
LFNRPETFIKIARLKFFLTGLIVLCLFGSGYAQKKKIHPYLVPCFVPKQTFKHFITKTPWIIQLGGNVVDDDGKPFTKVFDVKNSWNVPPYPTKLAIEKEFNYNWNVELAFTYNTLKAGKTINNDIYTSSGTFFSVDINGKKILTKLFRIEPYLFSGFGYTIRTVSEYKSIVTLNAGFGFNIWAIDNVLGLNIQGSGKFGLSDPILKTGSNYLQHSLGIIYKFSGNNKRLKAARFHIKKIYTK